MKQQRQSYKSLIEKYGADHMKIIGTAGQEKLQEKFGYDYDVYRMHMSFIGSLGAMKRWGQNEN